VLLAGLDSIFQVGVARALADGGAEVLDETLSNADALVRRAAERSPDAIVFGDGLISAAELGARLRVAAPAATLVLWRADASAVAVFEPGVDSPRVMPAPTAAELSNELFGPSAKGETWPST
jgi:hypothetical protein